MDGGAERVRRAHRRVVSNLVVAIRGFGSVYPLFGLRGSAHVERVAEPGRGMGVGLGGPLLLESSFDGIVVLSCRVHDGGGRTP